MSVKAIAITKGIGELEEQSAQDIISYVARVSNPSNQMNFDTASKLLKYCLKNKHFSIFEHAHMTLEIKTTRAIAAQILRHRSFCFQEFSQRYAQATNYKPVNARSQDMKNRQNSIDDLSEYDKNWFLECQKIIWNASFELYNQALNRGIAKESARFLLPLNTETTIYMTGNIRNWIHYIELRSDISTQLEHREVALECKKIFSQYFPDIAKALEWI